MINALDKHKIYRFCLSILCLLCIQYSAPWPGIQSILNTFLVLGLAPSFDSPLTGVIWAAASGWILEGTLKMYPHLGGTAFANMLMCLLTFNLLLRWPTHGLRIYYGRQVILVVIHTLLVYLSVRLTAGPHTCGTGWVWSLLLMPALDTVATNVYHPLHRK